jgi:hypothetical protein
MSIRSSVTVTVPATTYDLVTLAIVKSDWNITDTSFDSFLARSISRCSAAAAQYCNRVFPSETVVETFFAERDVQPMMSFNGVDPLGLTRWPLGTITSVVEGIGTAAVTLYPTSDYFAIPENGFLLRLGSDGQPRNWPATKIVVTYAGGFASIPLDVQDAVSRMVWTRYAEQNRDPFIKRQKAWGVEEVEYWGGTTQDGNLDGGTSDILDNYRVPQVV